MQPHPLSNLSLDEANQARDIIVQAEGKDVVILFRGIMLEEPAKSILVTFLDLERSGKLTPDSVRPPRLARCQYDVAAEDKLFTSYESVVDLKSNEVIKKEIVEAPHQQMLNIQELELLVEVCQASPAFRDAMAEFELPDGFEVVIEPWPYGGDDGENEQRRYFQGLVFAQDTNNKNPDSNFYAYPLPIIPVMDAYKREIVRIDHLSTGGKGENPAVKAKPAGGQRRKILEHCKASEYVPELLPQGTRTDLKPLNVVQPEGTSFKITDESLVQWQGWSFRITFNPREGAVVHDVHYNGRSIFYRLSISEMTVPYADARYPFHRKQAFDFGDGGAGNQANNLKLGCDCLGAIKYLDGITIDGSGKPKKHPNVVCIHEQDNGICWKHTNWRTGRAVVVRNRELVVQFIITLANYEYIFAYKFDQAGAVTIETRATGIVSVVNIDPGATSDYGNVVSPGALAQNHQHIFCARIDPAIDGHSNTVIQEESHTVPRGPSNPRGNYYEVSRTPIKVSQGTDAAPQHNRVFKIVNESRKNAISGRPVGYKFSPPPTQLLLADPGSLQYERALFAKHHVWVTKYKDNELYAGGRFTLQSSKEVDGVADAAARQDKVEDEDIVVWSVFGLTHNPRVEDWPVMPIETLQVNLRPADFFEENPSINVPSSENLASRLVVCSQ
ncbi:copper amine oxidase 1 [Periconia macrospinosa]|uniref:Amine oxidase n=1 Tax=Periconia macrospinosa TaxID=97972 RepID=A0A2V1E0J8_9PLEO|nr:copper amine oxidase 1 [Periconia macrospinosa]